MTTVIDFMQTRLFKSLRKRGVSHQTALDACQHTLDKDLKWNTLAGNVLNIDSLENIGFSKQQADEIRSAYGLSEGSCISTG